MAENEARDFLGKFTLDRIGYASGKEVDTERFDYFAEVLRMAMIALTDIQQYRAIGTVEECREARERQKAKKRKLESYCGFNSYECPVCCVDVNHEYNFCPNCGQRLE